MIDPPSPPSPPQPMSPHLPREFNFAERTLAKMVLDSTFFPLEADRDDWFKVEDESEDAVRANVHVHDHGSTKNRLNFSDLKNTIPSSSATASTHSMTSLANSQSQSSPGASLNDIPPCVDSDGFLPSMCPLAITATMNNDDNHDDGPRLMIDALMSESSTTTTTNNAPLAFPPLGRRVTLTDNNFRPTARNANEELPSKDAHARYHTTTTRSHSAPIPCIHEKGIEYGKLLGTGGFCEVRLVTLRKDHGGNEKSGNNDNNGINEKPRQYAMKYLSLTKTVPKIELPKPVRNKQFERGIADLAIEARFLTLLSHENIIGMHYVSKGRLEEQFNCCEWDQEDEDNYGYRHQFGYFLLLDPLVETLTTRIDETYIPEIFEKNGEQSSLGTTTSSSSTSWWKRMMTASNPSNTLPMNAWKLQLAQRLESLKGIASALQYLHDNCRVVYRDVKPDNMGFHRRPHPTCYCGMRSKSPSSCTCHTDVPKIFDFGLAKELKPKYLKVHPHHVRDPRDDGDPLLPVVDTYKLTARAGSRRYMAPEVAFSTPYNEKADVYSFGIVLYQVASLVTPFEGYSMYRHEHEILSGGGRPSVKIPCSKRSLNKIKKSCGTQSYVEWFAQDDADRMNKQLMNCTKCVWTKELKALMDECWLDDMRFRPSMKDVVNRLEGCIQELRILNPQATSMEMKRKSLGHETECLGLGSDGDGSDGGRGFIPQ